MITSVKTRTSCRVCGSKELTPVLSLGDQCIAGAFGEGAVQRAVPLELVRCDTSKDENACGLVQTRHTVPPHILYSSYWYRSGVNRTMTDNLHGIAKVAQDFVGVESDDVVLDIGCNDGTLFDGYSVPHLRFLGYDPSDVSRYAVEKGYEIVNDVFSKDHFWERYGAHQAKIITSIAMFYDLEDPAAFARDIEMCLAEDGLWVMELHYLPSMLAMNSFDAIVHEHLGYYSLAVLERLISDAGLAVVDAELNDMNGGSIRLLIGHRGRYVESPSIQSLRLREFELALDSPEPYEQFRRNAENIRDELRLKLLRLKEENKIVHIYGASTKGNTILQYADIDSELVPFAADRNPDKWGTETVRSRIPIISEQESRAMNPDYYLVLPWHFLDEFMERERDYLSGGGKFIVPLPEVRIVGATAGLKVAA